MEDSTEHPDDLENPMDQSALNTAQTEADQADRRLKDARHAERTASNAYDQRRRYAPTGKQTDAARRTWALHLLAWVNALVAREAAHDRVASERRAIAQAEARRAGIHQAAAEVAARAGLPDPADPERTP